MHKVVDDRRLGDPRTENDWTKVMRKRGWLLMAPFFPPKYNNGAEPS